MGLDLLFLPLALLVAIAGGRVAQRLWDRRRARRMDAAARRFGLRYARFSGRGAGAQPSAWAPRARPLSRVTEEVDGVLGGQRVFFCTFRHAEKGGEGMPGRCRALVAVDLGERTMPEGLLGALEAGGRDPWLDAAERAGTWVLFWGRRPLAPALFGRLASMLTSLR